MGCELQECQSRLYWRGGRYGKACSEVKRVDCQLM